MTRKLKQQRIIYRIKINPRDLLYFETNKSKNTILHLNRLYGLRSEVVGIWNDASGYLLNDVDYERVDALAVFEETHAFEAEHLDDGIAT